MTAKKISTWIFYIVAGVVFVSALSTSVSSFKGLSSLDKVNELLNEEDVSTDYDEFDSNLYEPIDTSTTVSEDTVVYELIEDDENNTTAYSIDIVNFKILLNDNRIDYNALEEIYDGIKIHFAGKLQKDYIFYIEESSIVISDSEVSFKLMDSSTKKEFETLTIKYK